MLKAKLLGATAGAEEALAIEDVFSTYLYTGNGTSQTINNGIDLAGEGGLVWTKSRSAASTNNNVYDTARGVNTWILTDNTSGSGTTAGTLTAFNSNGFSLGNSVFVNASGQNYASWTFRQAPRFFDVVTYTGTGANRTIAHDLGVAPGCIFVKRTDTTGDWQVYHRSLANTEYLVLNSSAVKATGATRWNSTTPTSSVFSIGTDATVNASGGTYVAYLFAHDPLGPSGDGSDGLIACGSYVGTGNTTTGQNIDIGWEPQWVMVKSASSNRSWVMADSMRGFTFNVNGAFNYTRLYANQANAESNINWLAPTATGFNVGVQNNNETGTSGETYTYIAIRRGPMREPTVGTQVFTPTVYTGTNTNFRLVNTSLLTDMVLVRQRSITSISGMVAGDRTRGMPYLFTGPAGAEAQTGTDFSTETSSGLGNAFSSHTGFFVGNSTNTRINNNTTANNHIACSFRRAPGFFDVVSYTGTGSARTINHNLSAIPELLIVRARSITGEWAVYSASTGAAQRLELNSAQESQAAAASYWNLTTPTSVVFSVGSAQAVNQSGATYIAYLFASLPGVSKVGSYTGNGSNQTINCAFTTGARFVLIKRTDVAGDWYVWDTARGIVSGNDPHLSLNTTAAEVTTDDTIDPDSTGFIVNQVAATNVNVNAATYIFLAIA